MEGTNEAQLRPTVWPGGPIPCPNVVRTDTRLATTHSRNIPVIEYLFEDANEITIPDDFVLREIFDVNLTPEGLSEFTGRWGSLTRWGKGRLDAIPSGWVPQEVTRDIFLLEPEIPEDGPRTTWIIPVSTAALHVRILRTLALQLAAFVAGGIETKFVTAWTSQGFPAPNKLSQSWLWFDSLLNAALLPYHAHVQFYPGGTLTGAQPMPTLYQACALQLYNYISEAVPFAICANERCGKLFTRQRGRARYGHNRSTGVRFCSHSCAKAQGERERRRRLRQNHSSSGPRRR
jgi:hypothetical protein